MNWKEKQKRICIVPFVSTAIILFITAWDLKRQHASFRKWLQFNSILFVTGAVISAAEALLGNADLPLLHALILWIITVIANFCLLKLQVSPDVAVKPKQHSKAAFFHNRWLVLLILPICIIPFLISVCQIIMEGSKDYPDLNGTADTSLCTIEQSEILNTTNGYSAKWVSHGHTGERTQVFGDMEDDDYDNVSFHSKKIDGIITLQSTKVMKDTVKIVVESTVKAGNMEIVILIDGEYYCNVDTNCSQSIELDNIAGKLIVVRMAAESAEVDVKVERSY